MPDMLATFRLHPGMELAQSSPSTQPRVTLASPARDVMTDLTQVRAATTHPSASLREAELAMIYQGVRMLFVVSEMPVVEGLVTLTDLHGDRQMRAVHERGAHYDDLRVADVMTEIAMLDAVERSSIASSSVGQVVTTLRRHGRDHLLVVDTGPHGAPRLRGVISRTQIERQLGWAVDVTPIASSFSEIERALH